MRHKTQKHCCQWYSYQRLVKTTVLPSRQWGQKSMQAAMWYPPLAPSSQWNPENRKLLHCRASPERDRASSVLAMRKIDANFSPRPFTRCISTEKSLGHETLLTHSTQGFQEGKDKKSTAGKGAPAGKSKKCGEESISRRIDGHAKSDSGEGRSREEPRAPAASRCHIGSGRQGGGGAAPPGAVPNDIAAAR